MSRMKNLYVFFLCIYLFSLPLGAMSIGAIGSALKLLAIFPVLLAIFEFKNYKPTSPIKIYFLYILICGFSVLYALNVTAAWGKFSSLVLLFLLLASTGSFNYSNEDINRIKNALIWSSRISVVLCLIFNNYVEGRLYFKNDIFSEDPNYFCAYLSFGIIYAIERLFASKQIVLKITALVELGIYLTVALLTGSRGGLLALLFGALIYIICSAKKTISFRALLVLISIILCLYIGISFLSEEMLVRFTIQNVKETGGTGRIEIWKRAFQMFKISSGARKIFGQGIGNTIAAWSHYGINEFHVCHNMFIESLIEIGCLGALVYTYMIFTFIKASFVQQQKFAFGVIMIMFILSLSTSISTFKPYFNIMLYILCLGKCTEARRLQSKES